MGCGGAGRPDPIGDLQEVHAFLGQVTGVRVRRPTAAVDLLRQLGVEEAAIRRASVWTGAMFGCGLLAFTAYYPDELANQAARTMLEQGAPDHHKLVLTSNRGQG